MAVVLQPTNSLEEIFMWMNMWTSGNWMVFFRRYAQIFSKLPCCCRVQIWFISSSLSCQFLGLLMGLVGVIDRRNIITHTQQHVHQRSTRAQSQVNPECFLLTSSLLCLHRSCRLYNVQDSAASRLTVVLMSLKFGSQWRFYFPSCLSSSGSHGCSDLCLFIYFTGSEMTLWHLDQPVGCFDSCLSLSQCQRCFHWLLDSDVVVTLVFQLCLVLNVIPLNVAPSHQDFFPRIFMR